MIIQTNTWICENCGEIETTTEKVEMYEDPVVTPPDGWEFRRIGGVGNLLLCCPACAKANSYL